MVRPDYQTVETKKPTNSLCKHLLSINQFDMQILTAEWKMGDHVNIYVKCQLIVD